MKRVKQIEDISVLLYEEPIRDLVLNLHQIYPTSQVMFFNVNSNEEISLVGSSGLAKAQIEAFNPSAKGTVCSSILKKPEPTIFKFSQKTKRNTPVLPETKSILVYPIMTDKKVTQIVLLENELESFFQESDLTILQGLVAYFRKLLVLQAQSADLTDQLSVRDLLSKHSELLLSKIESEEILQSSLDFLCKTLDLKEGIARVMLPDIDSNLTVIHQDQNEVNND